MDWFANPITTFQVALFSAAWFVLGVVCGTRLKGNGRPKDRAAAPRRTGNGAVEIYVGNLAYEVSEKDLAAAFELYGRVAEVRLIQHRQSGKSKGFGFVEMADREQAEAAIRALNGKELMGRKLVVNEARSESR
jgi:RNA recognition motif-containing protein